ncbi:hypothetical protein [Streptomyces sp. NBC_01602]|uniref:hypothetical protein n=1 Tax=Streptomyces sp. NBC_01602 TaxID=2975893 RepID=UPI00387086B6|nr:hypothetical protein OG955_00075 [Streptomyces sp. NBC_01602]
MTQPNPSEPDTMRPAGPLPDKIGSAAETWTPCAGDTNLRTPPSPGSPARAPHGEDLDLHIGWDRFEKLLLALSRNILGLRDIRFRRYGVQGQEQHGIDLAGREPDGGYTVVQCKDYAVFTTGDLRKAVEKFAAGRRPFNAGHFIVATSASTDPTQLNDELAALQLEHPDLELDLWGSEQINEHLRFRGDIVAQFWTRETAADFCTGAPLPGVPAPPPDRQEQAERILVGPLNTDDVAPILRAADSKSVDAPQESASLYGDLAQRLDDAGYRGHASVLRRRQLEALQKAGLFNEAIALAAELAAAALHHGDGDQAKILSHRLDEFAREAASAGTQLASATTRHAALIAAAAQDISHPLTMSRLPAVLDASPEAEPGYWPLLVLMLAECRLATEPDTLEELDPVIRAAVTQAHEQSATEQAGDTVIRLRLLRAEYDRSERQGLLREARQHRIKGRRAALISAREARQCALEGRAEEAVEYWRDAVQGAIHAGLAEEAADWLYAIRAANVRYGPWTISIDDEHHLAQALRTTGSGRLLDRMRDPREHAMSALVRSKPIEAVLAARRWLTDSVVMGSWADESEALVFLGDLYRDHAEPNLAAAYYQRAGNPEKLLELANSVGDMLLPLVSGTSQPWWVLRARAALIAAQADLGEGSAAQELFDEMLDLAIRGRAGELVDSRTGSLTLQAAKSACALAPRSTPAQAAALLDLLGPDVPREPHHYSHTDDEHATACLAIAAAHPELAMSALTRLFDLADVNTDKALRLLVSGQALRLMGADPSGSGALPMTTLQGPLSGDEQNTLRGRADQLAQHGHYLADVVQGALNPNHPEVQNRATAARDRILNRPEPESNRISIGSAMVPDSTMVLHLAPEDQQACLEKLVAVAGDQRESASNRQDALIGAYNLVIDQPPALKATTFRASQLFALGEFDGSRLDEFTGPAHPLSSFKVNFGSASLRGHGLRLAAASATTPDEQTWVRDQATELLRSADESDVLHAALALSQLPRDVTADIDTHTLADHGHIAARQLSAVLCVQDLGRYANAAKRLAADPSVRVRRTLAEAAATLAEPRSPEAAELLDRLNKDPHSSIRAAARAPFRS